MRNTVEKISSIPYWYGMAIILVYALLMAEYLSEINDLCMDYDMRASNIIEVFLGISYVLTILSSVVIWIVLCLMFHLTALLLDGKQDFSKFLFTSSYLYIIPIIALIVAIVMLGTLEVDASGDAVVKLLNNSSFKLIMNIVNYSFFLFYALTACIIHYLYKIGWLYSILSVAVPVVAIWGMTEFFKLL